MRQGIFLPESTSDADSLTISVEPSSAIACVNICVHVKNPKHLQPYHCLDTGKGIIIIIIIIMYIYHALINALSAHMIHINLNMTCHTN